MRKIGILFALVLFTFMGCSKDDDGGTPNSPAQQVVDRSANLLAAGDSANDILSNDSFTSLRIEIAYVAGFRPTQTAINAFDQYLRDHTFKTDIAITFTELSSPNEETLTLQEIADLEAENRTVYNDGETLGIYIYFTDAPSETDDEDEGLVTLGAVYRNTSMVIYESTIQRLTERSVLITVADVEEATLNHEFGHLFGLVNLGSPAVNDHEDPEAENHCNVPGCLMRAELQFGAGIMGMMESRASRGMAFIPELDAECVLDLQANGGR
ncbi:hypothetical protein [Spongiimicrobium sp. 2-473A-2-J]|uniref:hypothetical protein n=1 Tax=Eudoraea algarum TaxID=3417568 RepID=UPI003D35A09E